MTDIVKSNVLEGEVLFRCTCSTDGDMNDAGHRLSCPSILGKMYRKELKEEIARQHSIHLTDRINKGETIPLIPENIPNWKITFDMEVNREMAEKAILSSTGNPETFSIFSRKEINNIVINFTEGGGELEGLITTILIILRDGVKYRSIMLESPVVDLLWKYCNTLKE